MKTESNNKPNLIEIRKLGTINKKPVIYLYLNNNIKETQRQGEHDETETIYTYDTIQLTSPIPDELLKKVDTNKISHHSYNQHVEKQLAQNCLKQITIQLQNKDTKIYLVSIEDKLTQASQVEAETIKQSSKVFPTS